jgi:adenylate cyclase
MTPQEQGRPLREELERVLASTTFARSDRLSKLLRSLVERSLEGRESELKETSIGVELFGRKADYDPKLDSTVRTEASRLRARLVEYYSSEGNRNPFVIELPKGGYVPKLRVPEPATIGAPTRPSRVWLATCLAAFGAVAVALGGWWILHKPAPIRIAVLPLMNLSPDPANDFLADGLTSEIISELSIIDGLSVRSQTSSFALRGKQLNVHEAGSQLDADYILEGSVVRSGDQLRIDTRLVRVRDDFSVWACKFERQWTDVRSVQDQISLEAL